MPDRPAEIPALCETKLDYLGFDYNRFNQWVSKNITHWFRKNLSSICIIYTLVKMNSNTIFNLEDFRPF